MKESTPEYYQERILRVMVYIQTHLDSPLSLDELAKVACFSPFHFHRVFRGIVGEPVAEHVRRLRLERAAGRLKFTDQPIIDIALDSGYDSHEAFTRAFNSAFGRSPSAYRAGTMIAPPEGGPWIDARVESFPKVTVAFVRHTGPYAEVGKAWQKLFPWIMQRSLFRSDTKMIGICHDDPDITQPERLRYDASASVPEGTQPEGEIGIQEIPASDYGVAIHQGPYDRMGETFARVCGEWLPWSGRELAFAPALEIYLNSPQMASPENLLTKVCLPLEP